MTIIGIKDILVVILPLIIFGIPILLGIAIDRIDYWQDVKSMEKKKLTKSIGGGNDNNRQCKNRRARQG